MPQSESPADEATKTSSSSAEEVHLPTPREAPDALFEAEAGGYAKGLKRRHIQMIAVGGAIGTGLFLAAGGRLHTAGPSLVIVYGVCGVIVFLVLRALAEMVLYRPTSGSFMSYSREFLGEKAAFVSGWMYFLLWATVGIADITAVALYAKYWGMFDKVPQWVIALVALVFVLAVNLVSAKLFGEIEFWGAIIKVGALVGFMAIGAVVLGTGTEIDGHTTGISVVTDNGGLLPHGFLAAVIVIPGVIFAYSSLELVSIAAGETKEPRKIVPRATNSVIYRVAFFYCGSVLILALLLPWSAYSADESPFVTVLSAMGIPAAASVMNFVVLTAALSSVNSGLYATARILRSMAISGSAPTVVGKMSKSKVPVGAIALVSIAYAVGIVLNFLVPSDAFEIVLNFAALGILSTWMFILVTHLVFLKRCRSGQIDRPKYRLFLSPWTNYVAIAFLIAVFVLMWWDVPVGRITVIGTIPIALLLVGGWYLVRNRVAAKAAEFTELSNK